jgi:hypothetical protein
MTLQKPKLETVDQPDAGNLPVWFVAKWADYTPLTLPNTLTEADKETLAGTDKKWRHLGWFQLALIPVILGFLVAGSDVPGASWLILEQFLGVAFVFSLVGAPGVLSGSRLAVTALFSFAVLVLLGMIIQILGEPSVSPLHVYHLREFAMVYVIETSWASMVVVWRRPATEAPPREQVALALFNRGFHLGELGRRKEAIAVYNDLLIRFGTATEAPIREHVAVALHNKGVCLGELGRREEAIAVYDDLLARFGTDTAPALREQVAWAKSARDSLRNS